jgi:Na+/citrate or Na+/malate symporter
MLGALFAPFGDNTPTTGDYLGGAAIFGLGGAA